MAPRARFELATLRLTAEEIKNLSAASGVAYTKFGAILTSLAAPNPAPKKHSQQYKADAAPDFTCPITRKTGKQSLCFQKRSHSSVASPSSPANAIARSADR
jgi:hypothetical protein